MRKFIYNGVELGDLDPKKTPDDIRKMYAGMGYAALTNAGIVGPKKSGEDEIYEFKASVGTKG